MDVAVVILYSRDDALDLLYRTLHYWWKRSDGLRGQIYVVSNTNVLLPRYAKLIQQKRKGVGGARCDAIESTSEDYIIFSDGHVTPPREISKMLVEPWSSVPINHIILPFGTSGRVAYSLPFMPDERQFLWCSCSKYKEEITTTGEPIVAMSRKYISMSKCYTSYGLDLFQFTLRMPPGQLIGDEGIHFIEAKKLISNRKPNKDEMKDFYDTIYIKRKSEIEEEIKECFCRAL
ncbi:hypothetical protein D1T48_gp24 [Thermoproteus tenax virus 1]|uniref:Uncharacterized 26.8 kDa protein n=1 Tax=Thermoproteus tenax virus 1 (strain KRA1) TaxID=10480 RepID=YORL_TTV1K|nr:hypothetical protein D1T48_gp24 [Thermoproteus tenax virus 1]P19296.1 RecName: Full=Uncharacterized 26.8 kDa protein [Thermoproteus tenax virus 1 (STRAIN KRA1)]CAA32992.1 unnamed protein product [Thermoproteus tenax virus 1]